MDQEKLIKKWINNDLNQSEMEDFNTCDDVSFLKKISEHVKYLKAPEYDSDLGLVDFKTNYATSKADSSQNWFVYFGRIAASVVVFLGLFFGLSCRQPYHHKTRLMKKMASPAKVREG